MDGFTYKIKGWADGFFIKRDALKNRAGKPPWISVRTHHDGYAIRQISVSPGGTEAYGAFILIAAVVAKTDTEHGRLVDDGHVLTPERLAVRTGFPAAGFARAAVVLEAVGWLARIPVPGGVKGSFDIIPVTLEKTGLMELPPIPEPPAILIPPDGTLGPVQIHSGDTPETRRNPAGDSPDNRRPTVRYDTDGTVRTDGTNEEKEEPPPNPPPPGMGESTPLILILEKLSFPSGITTREQRKTKKAAGILALKGAAPDDVTDRWDTLKVKYPQRPPTLEALVRHWDALAPQGPTLDWEGV